MEVLILMLVRTGKEGMRSYLEIQRFFDQGLGWLVDVNACTNSLTGNGLLESVHHHNSSNWFRVTDQGCQYLDSIDLDKTIIDLEPRVFNVGWLRDFYQLYRKRCNSMVD